PVRLPRRARARARVGPTGYRVLRTGAEPDQRRRAAQAQRTARLVQSRAGRPRRLQRAGAHQAVRVGAHRCPQPDVFVPEARMAEIRRGESLPPRALRHLAHHAAIHLDVEWRDLDAAAWDASVVTAQGRTVPARETVWMRTR